jgi:hypothetical protein
MTEKNTIQNTSHWQRQFAELKNGEIVDVRLRNETVICGVTMCLNTARLLFERMGCTFCLGSGPDAVIRWRRPQVFSGDDVRKPGSETTDNAEVGQRFMDVFWRAFRAGDILLWGWSYEEVKTALREYQERGEHHG